MRAPTQVYADDVEVGQEIPELVKNCSSRQLVMWAAASGDFYEIHYDAAFATSLGLPGVVVHGALKNAFLGQLLHGWVAPEGRIVRFGCSYRGLDVPDEDLRCRGRVSGVRTAEGGAEIDLEIWIENARGEITTPGTAVVVLPARRAGGDA